MKYIHCTPSDTKLFLHGSNFVWKNSVNVVLKQDVEPGCFKYGVYTTLNPCKNNLASDGVQCTYFIHKIGHWYWYFLYIRMV
jgi:hypothetical protein